MQASSDSSSLNKDGRLSRDTLEWDRNRDTDFLCLSKGVYFMENISGNLQGVTMLRLEKRLNLGDFFRSGLRAKIFDSYRIFAELVQNPKTQQSIQETCQNIVCRVYHNFPSRFRS